jgi:hypothetical protein
MQLSCIYKVLIAHCFEKEFTNEGFADALTLWLVSTRKEHQENENKRIL